MPDLGDDDLKALRARLKELGPDGVRALLASDSFPTTHKIEIAKWLARNASADREPKPHHRPHEAR
jgi:hypothetical protein